MKDEERGENAIYFTKNTLQKYFRDILQKTLYKTHFYKNTLQKHFTKTLYKHIITPFSAKNGSPIFSHTS